MPVRIRLAQRGKKKNRTFRVIVADSRSPRDGKFIEDLGYYDPHHNPSMVEIDVDKAVAWLDKGAQPSERAQKNIRNFRCMGSMAIYKGRGCFNTSSSWRKN